MFNLGKEKVVDLTNLKQKRKEYLVNENKKENTQMADEHKEYFQVLKSYLLDTSCQYSMFNIALIENPIFIFRFVHKFRFVHRNRNRLEWSKFFDLEVDNAVIESMCEEDVEVHSLLEKLKSEGVKITFCGHNILFSLDGLSDVEDFGTFAFGIRKDDNTLGIEIAHCYTRKLI